MMRIALASFFDSRRYDEYPIQHALSSMRLGAYLAGARPDWTVRLRAFNSDLADVAIATALANDHFNIVGLPAYIWTRQISQQVAVQLARMPSPPLIVVGGPDTRTIDYQDWPDQAIFVMGQGEEPLHWLCERRQADPHFSGASLGLDVQHPIYSQRLGRASVKHLAAPTKDMKRLPHGLPLFDKDFNHLFERDEIGGSFTWFETARGCIYSCSFCGHNTLPFFATFDLEFVRREVALLDKRGIERVFVIDPILGGSPSRGKEILRIFQSMAPQIGISAYMRPEFLDEEFIDLLSSCNIVELLMGLQTTNPNVPKHIRGNNFAKIMRFVPSLAERGVPWRAELIVGLPGDNLDGLRESLRFTINELRPWSIQAYHLTAIPDTRLFGLVDRTTEEYWVRVNPRLRVIAANSFTESELEYMLAYAGAVTSLHRFLREQGQRAPRFEAIDAIVGSLLAAPGCDNAFGVFRAMDAPSAMRIWQGLCPAKPRRARRPT